MTTDELSKLRKALEASARELDGSARRRDSIAIEASADEFDRMHRAGEREIAVRGLEVISTRLRDVHAALGRINVGTFGLCLECDDELSPKRLAAVPWASLCIRCQEAEDGREREGYRVALPLAA